VVAGDFRRAVSVTADVYLMSQVLHDWGDDEAVTILRNCRRAMRSRSRLFLIERLLPLDDPERRGRLSDLNMLVLLGGRERSLDEYEQLLIRADYTPVSSGPVSEGWGVLEARP
jgi:O-methyltransferase domain